MRIFILGIVGLLSMPAIGAGPLYQHKNTYDQQEFDNVYHDLVSPKIGTGIAQNFTISSETVTYIAISTMTASSATITNLTVGTLTTSGTLGKLIQTVTFTNNTNDATTSSSFVDSHLIGTITPTSASNRVYVQVHFTGFINAANIFEVLTIKRGSTNIGGTNGLSFYRTAGGNTFWSDTILILDSPNATTATTYTLQFRNSDGATDAEVGSLGNAPMQMILQEIAP